MSIDDLIKKMQVEEKCHLLVGKNMWETHDFPNLDIPSLVMADGPHGRPFG